MQCQRRENRQGSSARIERKVCAADREGLPGARRSNSGRYCEYLQHRRPPESADPDGAVIRAEGPSGCPAQPSRGGGSADRDGAQGVIWQPIDGLLARKATQRNAWGHREVCRSSLDHENTVLFVATIGKTWLQRAGTLNPERALTTKYCVHRGLCSHKISF